MEHARRLAIVGLAVFGLPAATAAQAPGPGSPPPCSGPEHREFDFWVGDWDVVQADGTPAGTNRIERILDGCVLQESWRSANGRSEGRSFNIRGRDGKWHQTWVDNQGLLLRLEGGLDARGSMVMRQELVRPRDGRKVLHEIAWTSLETGQVRQHWRQSEDGGGTWQDVFVGIYTKRK